MPWQRLSYVKTWLVDGEPRTVAQIYRVAQERGSKVSRQTIRKRLNRGEANLNNLVSSVGECDSYDAKYNRKIRQKKKDEMAELIQRIGPPKRY